MSESTGHQRQENDLKRLTVTVDRFCQFIGDIPAETLRTQTWGPKEVLAHLVYHHELYVSLILATLAGEEVKPPQGRFKDLNAQAVRMSRGIPWAKLVGRFQQANRNLVTLYRQTDPGILFVEIKEGAKLRTLLELVPEIEAHIRNHLEKLRKEMGLQQPH